MKNKIARAFRNEHAFIDNLVGTMVAVVMFGIVTMSFSGIFMTYNVMSNKATENTARLAVVTTATQEAITNLYVDFYDGYLSASQKGWDVHTEPGLTLNQVAGLNPVEDWEHFTYAAQKPLTNGSVLTISQWGWIDDRLDSPERGLVKLYTATPKAQTVGPNTVIPTCNWSVPYELLKRNCIVVYDVVQSVYQPPIKYKYAINENWLDYANQFVWQDTDYSLDASISVSTQQLSNLGVLIPEGARIDGVGSFPISFIVKVEQVTVGQELGIDFVFANSPETFFSIQETITDNNMQYIYGTFKADPNILDRHPDGSIKEQSLWVYLDTDTTDGAAAGPTIRISQFFIYQTLPQTVISPPSVVSNITWDTGTYKTTWQAGTCTAGTLQHQYRTQVGSGPVGEWSGWSPNTETATDLISAGQTGTVEVRSRCYVSASDSSAPTNGIMSPPATRP